LLWWVSKNLVRIRVRSVLRRCFFASWASATSLGVVFWFFLVPVVHNLISVLFAFAAGYLLYLGCCAMIAYNGQERDYIRDLVRNQFRSGWRKSLPLLGGEP